MKIKNPFAKKNDSKVLTAKSQTFFDELAKSSNVQGMFTTLSKLPNPDAILRKSGKGIDTLSTLINHYQVGTCVDSRKAGTTKKLWSLEKEQTSSQNLEFYTNLFKKQLKVHELIKDVLDAPLYGYVVFEITWKKQDGYLIPAKIEAKPQEWFEYDTENRMYFKSKQGNLYLDDYPYKFIVVRNNPTFKNPYGQALLSRCFWMVAFINGGMEFWVKFTEKYGMPFLFGRYDRSMSATEREELLEALVAMAQDAIGVIPDNGRIEFAESSSKGASVDVYERLIQKCENNIAKSILGQTLTTDVGSSGSYAAANTHNQVRGDLIDSDTRLCEEFFNTLISFINAVNFVEEETPCMSLYEEDDVDLQIAERDTKIHNAGGRFSKNYFIKTYGFDKDDIEVEQSSSISSANFSETSSGDFDELDNLMSVFTQKDFEAMLNPLLTPIVSLFNSSRDAEETIEKLAEIYPQMNTSELEKALVKIIFISELFGRMKDE